MAIFEPAYIRSHVSGELKKKAEAAREILKSCTLCPRQCNVDRIASKNLGVCKTGEKAWVSSSHPHFGEESPLVGKRGSGTIFFTHCNLLCNFCQNYDISHEGVGEPVSDEALASMMLSLQQSGCCNINFVTPSHVVPQILSAVDIAAGSGLSVPLVYNTGCYDRSETLKLLDGVFDIYMPDFKFWDSHTADTLCNAPDYPGIAKKAILEMHRQVGDLTLDKNGLAQRGLLVRHLVLPENLAGTRNVMRFIAQEVSNNSYVNIMPQYRPCGKAYEDRRLCRHLSGAEYKEAVREAEEEGIRRFDRPKRVFLFWP